MIQACHSVATLKEMLHEAAVRLEHSPEMLGRRIEELERTIDEARIVSASLEQEIVSLFVLAELKSA